MHARTLVIASALALTLLSGCVTEAEHQRLMDDAAARMRATQLQHQQQLAGSHAQIVSLQNELTRLLGEITQRETRITEANAQTAALQRQLDEATALNQQLTAELEKTGKNVDELLASQGSLNKALTASKTRLEELRKAQEAANKRAELFRHLLLKFKKMIDSGELKILLRDGRMVLQLRNDVLFDSARVTIKKEGEDALSEVAGILITLDARKLQVAGHTDNVPIATGRFPSNWELSTARAVNVVKFLIEQGVKPELLSAAGYGANDPVSSNDTAEGKARNRRIEIVLQPNIAELVQVPDGP